MGSARKLLDTKRSPGSFEPGLLVIKELSEPLRLRGLRSRRRYRDGLLFCLGANQESALQAFHVSPVLVIVQSDVSVTPGAGLQVKSHLLGSYFAGKRRIRSRIRYENRVCAIADR
jgi:hypothetical protein